MEKIKISAVSYTNTKPFIYGLKHLDIYKGIELSLDIPADCAQKLIDNQVDIGLVPVAALPSIPNYQIISDYCIGAVGPVNSVFILSNIPIGELKTLKLDPQSRTSNNLARVLLKNYWKVFPEFLSEGQTDAIVLIGDRTFGQKSKYAYVYDLAEEWIKFTGLPFAFAVWVANKPIAKDFIKDFNTALRYGLEHRNDVINDLPKRNDFDLRDYLMNRIDYGLTTEKREAIAKFLSLVKSLQDI